MNKQPLYNKEKREIRILDGGDSTCYWGTDTKGLVPLCDKAGKIVGRFYLSLPEDIEQGKIGTYENETYTNIKPRIEPIKTIFPPNFFK